jgi:hypothetical protein
MGFSTAHDILGALQRQLGLNEDMYTVLQVWEKELGPLAQQVTLAAIKKGDLIVEVASSAHLQEMTMRRRDLVRKLNQYFGNRQVVSGIKLRLKK